MDKPDRMEGTDKQLPQRQGNGKGHGGPQTPEGQLITSQNACKHGILSARLLLRDEDKGKFDELLNELSESLEPVGRMECVLVEKIAINLWRQRRLVAAEAAYIQQEIDTKFGGSIFSTSTGSVTGQVLSQRVAPGSSVHQDQQFIQDVEKILPRRGSITGAEVLRETQTIFNHLLFYLHEQKSNNRQRAYKGKIEDFVDQHGDEFWRWVIDKAEAIRKRIQRERDRQNNMATAQSLPIYSQQFNRYQVMLDRELYRAIVALKALQDDRLRSKIS